MDDTPDDRTQGLGTSETFKTTCWSVVLSAGHDPADVARQSLELLCRAYWFPLYAYVRRHGHSPEDAQDLTQEFFAVFIARGAFARADRERGRFRTYLLTSLKHFLHEEWRRANRQKRGGGVTFVPMDADTAESRYVEEARDGLSPDLLYDRRWAEASWRGFARTTIPQAGQRSTSSSSSSCGAGRRKSRTMRWAAVSA